MLPMAGRFFSWSFIKDNEEKNFKLQCGFELLMQRKNKARLQLKNPVWHSNFPGWHNI